jgi:hypothetical protein
VIIKIKLPNGSRKISICNACDRAVRRRLRFKLDVARWTSKRHSVRDINVGRWRSRMSSSVIKSAGNRVTVLIEEARRENCLFFRCRLDLNAPALPIQIRFSDRAGRIYPLDTSPTAVHRCRFCGKQLATLARRGFVFAGRIEEYYPKPSVDVVPEYL